MTAIRVLVVDDEPLVRDALQLTLGRCADIAVVGTASNGHDAVVAARELSPDVVVMDVRMPGMAGDEATRHILRDLPGTRVLVLTTFDLDEHVHAALRAGAAGFVLKNTPTAQLVDAVRTVANGEAVLAPTVTRRLITTFAALPPALMSTPDLDGCTPREREVLLLVAKGLSNRQIATRLSVSESSVKSTVNRILTRLKLENRVQAALFVTRFGSPQEK